MGKHRKQSRKLKLAPIVTTGLALPLAGAMAGVYATNPDISNVGLAAHSIFVDGTVSPFLTDRDDPPGPRTDGSDPRMLKSFDGQFDFDNDAAEVIDYPGTLGIVSIISNGIGAPTFDDSEDEAVLETKKQLVDYQKGHAGETVYIVGYSQGASAVVRAIEELENDPNSGYDPTNVVVVLAANPRRNDGGLLTRVPPFTLPLVGATFGEGTTPTKTKIIQVTKQYDGVGDAPKYVLNPLADANAILGYVYLHGGYYEDVDIDPVAIDKTVNDGNATTVPPDTVVVTQSTNKQVTDILIKNKPGDLPLTMPLKSIGVPLAVIEALDPLLRAIIETGYDRPTGNTFPDAAVRFGLLPGPDQWAGDAQSVAAGTVKTGQALGGLGSNPGSLLPGSTAATQTSLQKSGAAKEAAPAGAAKPKLKIKPFEIKTPVRDATSSLPKFSPAKAPAGGYKPGSVLKSIGEKVAAATGLGPKPAKVDSDSQAADATTTSPGGNAPNNPDPK